jgi:hypothetical protein
MKEGQPLPEEIYQAQKRCYENRKAEAKEMMPHYSEHTGHKKRGDYWKQVKKDEKNQRKELR